MMTFEYQISLLHFLNCQLSFDVLPHLLHWLFFERPKNAPALWLSCGCRICVSGLRRPENLDFLCMHTSLEPGTQLLFRQK